MESPRRGIFLYLLLLIACLSAVACSGSLLRNCGRIIPDAEATRDFETYRVHPEYRYYISGADLHPNALMGLHRDYHLDPATLWREVVLTPAGMKEIVENMKTKGFEYRQFLYGFAMSDGRGRPAGVWYSLLSAPTLLCIQEDGTVRIDTPDQDTYDKFGREGASGN